MTTLAHLSDLHGTSVAMHRPLDFAGKRFFGWLSWRSKRRFVYRPEVLEALARDLAAARPDHVAVTGDLTNVATAEEFSEARGWLEKLGGPERVSVVPGNHDAYAPIAPERSWDLWLEYLRSDDAVGEPGFPSLRVRGGLALVGVNSALPTALFLATGRVGEVQLGRLERRLVELRDAGLCRIVLIHHPVTQGAVSPRRALRDAPALRAILLRTGAELVLHGHGHRTLFASLPGPSGDIPVVGVRSASDATERSEKRAQYHVYDIERGANGFRIAARIRGYAADGRFAALGEQVLRA
ncbi:MAG: metallophosphoesterase [Deltaproteobacteria bacterium]|nr:metallophosphoesterase [Deltaproteobacteria bacterium]MBW2359841.1 metallophosphoesterase [Deltaproteobacteria bacterium]